MREKATLQGTSVTSLLPILLFAHEFEATRHVQVLVIIYLNLYYIEVQIIMHL